MVRSRARHLSNLSGTILGRNGCRVVWYPSRFVILPLENWFYLLADCYVKLIQLIILTLSAYYFSLLAIRYAYLATLPRVKPPPENDGFVACCFRVCFCAACRCLVGAGYILARSDWGGVGCAACGAVVRASLCGGRSCSCLGLARVARDYVLSRSYWFLGLRTFALQVFAIIKITTVAI